MENTIAAFAQISLAALISLWTIAVIMRAAVDFDDETCFAHEEIRNVRADGVLPPNLEAKLATPQLVPK